MLKATVKNLILLLIMINSTWIDSIIGQKNVHKSSVVGYLFYVAVVSSQSPSRKDQISWSESKIRLLKCTALKNPVIQTTRSRLTLKFEKS